MLVPISSDSTVGQLCGCTPQRGGRCSPGSDLQLFRFEKLPGGRLHTYVSAASCDDVPDAVWPGLWERDYPLDETLNPFHRFGVNNGDGEALAVWRAFAWCLLDGLERFVIPAYYRDEAAAMLGISRADTTLVKWQYEIDTDEPAFSKADHEFVRGPSCVPIRPEPDDWRRANRDRAGVFPLSSFDDLTRVEVAVSGDAASEITLFGLESSQAGDLAGLLAADTPPSLGVLLGARGVFVDLSVVRDRFPGTTSYVVVRSAASLDGRIDALAAMYESRFRRYAESAPGLASFEEFGEAVEALPAPPL